MALSKETVVDRIEILEDGQMQIRTAVRIIENGSPLAQQFHRHVIEPGDDLTKEDKRVKDIGELIHTQAVIAEFNAKKAIK